MLPIEKEKMDIHMKKIEVSNQFMFMYGKP